MKITNKHNMRQSVYDAICYEEEEIKESNELIRVSSLSKTPRHFQLHIRHYPELEEDAMDRIWAFFGRMGHLAAQKSAEKREGLVEERHTEKVNGVEITGRSDLILPHPTKAYPYINIEDWKFTSAWTYVFNPKGNPEWIFQINSYDWLFNHIGFESQELVFNCIYRNWEKEKALSNKSYPQIPQISIISQKIDLKEVDVRIQEKVHLFTDIYRETPDDDLPICPEDYRWKKNTEWKIRKKGVQKARKVIKSSYNDAVKYMESMADKNALYIEEIPGVDTRCVDYCSVAPFCRYWRENYGRI